MGGAPSVRVRTSRQKEHPTLVWMPARNAISLLNGKASRPARRRSELSPLRADCLCGNGDLHKFIISSWLGIEALISGKL
jgi:hypothetical protein